MAESVSAISVSRPCVLTAMTAEELGPRDPCHLVQSQGNKLLGPFALDRLVAQDAAQRCQRQAGASGQHANHAAQHDAAYGALARCQADILKLHPFISVFAQDHGGDDVRVTIGQLRQRGLSALDTLENDQYELHGLRIRSWVPR